MNLKGRVALVTGGARVGQAVALALARRGVRLAVAYRTSAAAASAVVRRARALGVTAVAVPSDVRADGGASHLVGAVVRRFGRLDVLVNMASVYEPAPLKTLTEDEAFAEEAWRRVLEVDLRAAYRLSLKAAPWLRRRGGRIVNFSDWTAAGGRPRYKDLIPYYVAKGGVKALTEALALELAPDVLVNAVAPGPILPPPGLSRAAARAVARETPLGRWGGPEEVARAVLFLVETDFVTGECLRVDGGRHLR